MITRNNTNTFYNSQFQESENNDENENQGENEKITSQLTIITPVKNHNVIEGKISKSVAGSKAATGYVNFDEIQITPKF